MPLTPLTSPDDPRLTPYALTRDAEALGRHGVFLAEGEFVVRVLIGSPRFPVRSVLVTKRRVALAEELAALLPGSTPVLTVPDELISRVMGFEFHRGVMAAGEVPAPLGVGDVLQSRPGVVLALEGINNHDNMGSAFRNAAAFGSGGVLMDPRSCDPLYRKSIRVSMGHALTVPYARSESSRVLNKVLTDAGYTVLALTPGEGAVPLGDACDELAPGDRVCVLVGAEGPGLSVAAQRSATRSVRIPMAPGVDSLNLSTAAGIALCRVREALSAR